MSFNRLIYDSCEYTRTLKEQEGMLHYNLDKNKFHNCNQRRIDFGLLGGNQVSQTTQNLVDLESDLRNQTRLYSKCPGRKYLPTCNVSQCSKKSGLPCGDKQCAPKMHHMPESTLVDYRPRYNNKGYSLKGLFNGFTNPTMLTHKK